MIEVIFKYWGLDWAIFILVVLNLWFLGSKNHLKTAYFLGLIAAVLGILFNYWVQSCGGVVANLTFMFLHLRNIKKLTQSLSESRPSSSEDTHHTCLSPSASCLQQASDDPK